MHNLNVLRRKLPLKTAVAIEIILLFTGVAYFLHNGGEDLYTFYLPMARGCLTCAYNPWHTSWILFPLTLVPVWWLWTVWTLVTGLMLWWSARQLDVNPIVLLLSFPAMGLIWLGQVDGLVVLGLCLQMTSRSPWLRGAGIVLASVKPQVSAAAIPIMLWYDRDRWRTLVIPAAVLVASLIVWGVDWPLRWWTARDLMAGLPLWGTASFYPFGFIAFAAIFLVDDVRKKVAAALLASALALPQFGIYSYVAFLVFIAPPWALPLSYAWALAYPLIQAEALKFAGVLPLGLLIWLCWPEIRQRLAWIRRPAEPPAPPEPVAEP